MGNSNSIHKVLSVGFEGPILAALRSKFNITTSISQEEGADIDWDDLHLMRIHSSTPNLTGEMLDCFNQVKKNYLTYSNINSRRFYYINERDIEIYNAFVLTFYEVYTRLVDGKINLVLHSNMPHEGFDYLIYLICRYFGIRSVMCYQSLFPGYFWMTSNVDNFGRISLGPKLNPPSKSNYKLPNNWFYMNGTAKDCSYSILDLICEVIKKPSRVLPASIRYHYAREYKYHAYKSTQKRVDGDKYIYFPLHLQPELSTSSIGGKFADQLLAIEALSAWLPEEYVIYIKENPKQTEKERGKFFYKRLLALKNVRLLSPHENSIELIKSACAVATVTGTAGWEALFMGKPVLIFGLAWYREFSGVTQFDPAINFNKFIRGIPPAEESLVAELDLALQAAGVGVIDGAYRTLVKGFDDALNAESVADSIGRYVALTAQSPI